MCHSTAVVPQVCSCFGTIVTPGPVACTTALRTGGQEVLINRYAGESVLKGANVFAPGLLAATPGIAADDMVAVSVAVGQAGR